MIEDNIELLRNLSIEVAYWENLLSFPGDGRAFSPVAFIKINMNILAFL